jgi:hypothetical protein
MDHLQTRLSTLEQQMHAMNRRLHWWRGLACGLAVLAVLTWALPAVIAQEEASERGRRGLAQRVAALEELLKHFSREGKEIFITGANLHLVNGLGSTDCDGNEIPDCPNGLGNLIVGYNEMRSEEENIRTGSHTVVVGEQNNFSHVGGLVVGVFNTIRADFASVSGGAFNTASGANAAVSGGVSNTASGVFAAVSGGQNNTASGIVSSISGGAFNTANGEAASVSGGQNNTVTVSGNLASISGGQNNTASQNFAAVSGGQNIEQAAEFGWSAGSEAEEVVVGNFRSP